MKTAHLCGWAVVATTLTGAGVALACGANPNAAFGYADQPTSPSASVARDAPIVVALTCTVQTEAAVLRDAVCGGLSPGPQEAVFALQHAETDIPVAGSLISRHDALIFVPAGPLEPSTNYRATAGMGSPALTFKKTFRTDDRLLPALSSTTAPSVVPEWYDAPVTQCDGQRLVGQAALDALAPAICPAFNNCRADGSVRALRFHLQLGALSGGFSDLPYQAQLNVAVGGGYPLDDSGGAPGDAPGNGQLQSALEVYVPAGMAASLYRDAIKPDDLTQTLCVRARVFDVGGRVLSVPEQCATYVDWMTDAEWPDEAADRTTGADAGRTISADGGVSPAQPEPAHSPFSKDDGCSAGATSDRPPGGLLLLALAGLLRRAREKRARVTRAGA
jgi:MYXO-CTERM domain-containing protein